MEINPAKSDSNERMKSYLAKIATGPTMSKDLTQIEAEDALSLILNGEVSRERSAVFLIASRMKLETMEENMYEFNEMLDLRVESRAGSLKLLQEAWQSAKEMVDVKEN